MGEAKRRKMAGDTSFKSMFDERVRSHDSEDNFNSIGVYFKESESCGFEYVFIPDTSKKRTVMEQFTCVRPIGMTNPETGVKLTFREVATYLVETAQGQLDGAKKMGHTLQDVLDLTLKQCREMGRAMCIPKHKGGGMMLNDGDLFLIASNVIILETFGIIPCDTHNGILYSFMNEPFRAAQVKWNGAV